MAPAEVHALISDLVRAGTDADLVGRVAAALVTGDVSVTSQTSRGVTAVTPRERSAGAIRTARWRAKKRLLGLDRVVTSQVTPTIRENVVPVMAETAETGASLGAGQVSGGVTPVTLVTSRGGGSGKKKPPHTPIRKTTPQYPPRQRRRHAVTEPPPVLVDRSKPDRRGRLWVDASDPIYLDLQAHSPTRSLPGSGDGWWFAAARIAEARERLGRKVTALPVAARSTGPPESAVATKA